MSKVVYIVKHYKQTIYMLSVKQNNMVIKLVKLTPYHGYQAALQKHLHPLLSHDEKRKLMN